MSCKQFSGFLRRHRQRAVQVMVIHGYLRSGEGTEGTMSVNLSNLPCRVREASPHLGVRGLQRA